MPNNNYTRTAQVTPEGDGVEVRRLFPVPGHMHFDPFVLCDHFVIEPGHGFPEHPHRGFEGITYLLEGSMRHRDNLGNESTVGPNGLQRFTAGRGILHSEMPVGRACGIQLWVNLPRRLKQIAPDYQQVEAAALPLQSFTGGQIRILAGPDSPLRLHTPIRYVHLELAADVSHTLDWADGERVILYLISGQLRLSAAELQAGMAWFGSDATEGPLRLHALQACQIICVLGVPHGEPIYQHGPYVD